MGKPTGRGKYFIAVDGKTKIVQLWLYNYDVGGAAVKKEHQDVLDGTIGPLVQDGGNIKMLGLASTTGEELADKQLSERRIGGVNAYLQSKWGTKFTVSKQVGFGKGMALAFNSAGMKGGTANNTEAEIWRGVVINAWNKDTEPPPPTSANVPINNPDWAGDFSQKLDSVSMALGMVDFIADLAALEAISAVTGPAGLIISSLQTILALPLTWISADNTARYNGKIQGAADALQDLADQYSDANLDKTQLSKWPAVKVPTPHISGNFTTDPSVQAWQAGQLQGLREVTQMVVEKEQNPIPVTTSDGRHIRVSGRMWLRALSVQFKDMVGRRVIIDKADEALKAQGKRPWPTI